MKVNREQITAARRSDLFDFLRQTYPDKFIRTPRNLFLKENQSLVIHIGYSGYRDYVWKRLYTISAEDCHGIITKEIEALWQGHELVNKTATEPKGRIFVSKAFRLIK